ncbi:MULTISPECIES: hypothetical protein [unclassified Rhizobium]|uniref:hypothetical protein n=1 Tax=unclassified Rhizobium TaxID=2613769 RepID=UPI000ABBB1BA|nr:MULTISPECIES: hypothetical protein [unclassified Rhizobium]
MEKEAPASFFYARKPRKHCATSDSAEKSELRKIVSFHLSGSKTALCIVMIQVDETDVFRFAA